MVDLDISKVEEIGTVKKRHPKMEDYSHTMHILVKNRVAMTGIIITSIYFLIALLDVVYPQYLGMFHAPMSASDMRSWALPVTAHPIGPTLSHGWEYIFGETQFLASNFPLFPIMLAALKFDLGYALLIVLVGALSGTFFGAVAGYLGGIYDEILMRVTDVFYSVPFLILALAFIFLWGHLVIYAVYALMIVWWPIYARLGRGQALYVRSMKFVEAATASGVRSGGNIISHIFPNLLSPVFVQISLDLGSIMQLFAVLFFLNVISSPYLPELGNIVNYGQNWIPVGVWWPVLIPALFILIFTVSVNLMGDGLRDVLDPKLRR